LFNGDLRFRGNDVNMILIQKANSLAKKT